MKKKKKKKKKKKERKLFDLYKILTCNNYDYVEIDRDDNNYNI